MPQQIEFEGVVHEFPDDFTDADISAALGGTKTAPQYEDPNQFQRAMHGPLKGIAGVLGLPGFALEGTANALDAAREGVHSAVNWVTNSDAPYEPSPVNRTLAEAGQSAGPQAMQGAFRAMGAMPADPNYEHPVAENRMLDTVNEYMAGAVIPAGAAAKVEKPALAIGELLAGLFGGATAAPVREAFPDQPLAELPAALIGASAPAAARSATARVGGTYRKLKDPYTDAGRQRQVSDVLKSAINETGGTVDDVVSNIKSGEALAGDGFAPTTGTTSGNSGLLAVERSAATSPRYVDRAQSNARSVADSVNDTLDTTGATPAKAAQDFVGQQHNGMVKSADAAVDAANTDLAGAKTSLQAEQGAVPAGGKAAASETVKLRAEEARQGAKVEVRKAYSEVDPNTPAAFDETVAAAKTAAAEIGDTGVVPPVIQRILKAREAQPSAEDAAKLTDDVTALRKKWELDPDTPDADGTQTFADMERDLKNVNEAIREAQVAGKENTVRVLNIVKDGINADMDTLGASSDALRAANSKYANDYAPKYKTGPSKGVFREGGVPDSRAVDKYMQTKEGAVQLRSILDGDKAGTKAVEDWAVADLADTSRGTPLTANKIASWQAKRADMLDQFPSVRNRIESMRSSFGKSEGKIAALEQRVKDAVASGKETKAALKSAPAGALIDGDPTEAVGKALSGSNPADAFGQMVAAARKDPSGAALDGLRTAAKNWLNRHVRNTGKTTTEGNAPAPLDVKDLKASYAKMNEFLSKPGMRKALSDVFDEKELKHLDRIRKRMETMDRVNTKATAGSDTADLLANLLRGSDVEDAIGAYLGPIQGTAMNRLRRFFEKNFMQGHRQKAADLLIDSMLDPDLAEALLLRPTEVSVPKIEKALGARLTSAAIAGEQGSEEE